MCRRLIYLVSFVLVLGLTTGVANAAPLSQSPGTDGIVSVEAEHFDNKTVGDNGDEWMEVGPTGGFTGTLGMQSQPDDNSGSRNTNYAARSPRLDYEIDFIKTGTHYVWILGWADDGNSDSCHAGLDGEEIPTCDRMAGWSGDYEWNGSTMDEPRSTFEVTTTGVHTLNIWMREDGLIIDKIVLTTNPDFTLTGSEPGPPESVRGPRAMATEPSPADGASDVQRDVVLSWIPGEYAPPTNGHKVYFSSNFNDVSAGIGGVTVSAASYTPPRLDLDTTYYWRVDEVNGPPDHAVYEGPVWSFTTEPVAYPVASENITATASSAQAADMGPENTINGSGLDENDLHSAEETTMWLSGTEPLGAWIEFEFDKVYKLHQMWVWNSNQTVEPLLGFGFKDVTIEYSANGTDYTTLGTTHEFARAPGTAGYAHNTTVDLSGVVAQYVRLTPNSNWGGVLPQYGLSEVRFFYIPIRAWEASPDPGATDVDPDVTLGWRPGREAAEHHVYFSPDEQAVTDGNAPVTVVAEARHGPLSLDLGQTYYWKINEVNMAETSTTLDGDVWDFTTDVFLVVDDFESYNDLDPINPESNRIFNAWIDGYDIPTNGSIVGYDQPPFAEQNIVSSGKQAMPLFYDNSGTARYSEAELSLSPAQDWTKHGIAMLSLSLCGDPNNAVEQIYVKVNGSKVVYGGDAGDIKRVWYEQWNIDVASLGVNLQNVTKLGVGVGDETSTTPGGSGVLYVDDIRLYRSIPGPPAGIWIEAEAADSITSPMEIFDHPAASGGKCIGTTDDVGDSSDSPPTPAGTATYTFTVEGGIYKVSCRIIIPAGDSFWVRIPGATNLTPGEDPGNPGTGWVRWSDPPNSEGWYWEDVFSGDHDEEVANWTLPAGTHTLEIAYREDAALMDAIVISKVD